MSWIRNTFRRIRPQLPAILLEAGSVIFAVLVALAIDDWRNRRAEARLATEAQSKLEQEIRTNRDNLVGTLEEQIAAHEELVATLAELEQVEAPEGDFGFHITGEQLRDTAWQTALYTQAVRFMDFDEVSRISDIYDLQEIVETTFRRLLETMTSMDLYSEDRPLGPLRSLAANFDQLITLERQLMERYDAFLEENDPAPTPLQTEPR